MKINRIILSTLPLLLFSTVTTTAVFTSTEVSAKTNTQEQKINKALNINLKDAHNFAKEAVKNKKNNLDQRTPSVIYAWSKDVTKVEYKNNKLILHVNRHFEHLSEKRVKKIIADAKESNLTIINKYQNVKIHDVSVVVHHDVGKSCVKSSK